MKTFNLKQNSNRNIQLQFQIYKIPTENVGLAQQDLDLKKTKKHFFKKRNVAI